MIGSGNGDKVNELRIGEASGIGRGRKEKEPSDSTESSTEHHSRSVLSEVPNVTCRGGGDKVIIFPLQHIGIQMKNLG